MRTLALLSLLAGCESATPSSSMADVFQPRPASAAVGVTPQADGEVPPDVTPEPPEPEFDFDEDAPSDGNADSDAERDLSEADLMAGFGLAPTVEEPPVEEVDPMGPAIPEGYIEEPPAAAPAPEPVAAAVTPASWTPAAGLAGSWGVRLVSTVTGTQPPRAILGLGSGEEVVVEPGTLLPQARLVVLAVGQDAVQVAEIIPQGDRARVETRMLTPMYRSTPPPPQ